MSGAQQHSRSTWLTVPRCVAKTPRLARRLVDRQDDYLRFTRGILFALHQRNSAGLDIPLDEVIHEGPHEVQIGAVVGSCKGQRELLLGGARQR